MTEEYSEKEKFEIRRQEANAALDRHFDFESKMNDAAISSAHNAIKTLIIFHGGALVALMTFIPAMVDLDTSSDANQAMTKAMLMFALGLSLAGLCSLLAYLVNYCNARHASSMTRSYQYPYLSESDASKPWRHAMTVLHMIGVIAAIASFIFFVIGFVQAKEGIFLILD